MRTITYLSLRQWPDGPQPAAGPGTGDESAVRMVPAHPSGSLVPDEISEASF